MLKTIAVGYADGGRSHCVENLKFAKNELQSLKLTLWPIGSTIRAMCDVMEIIFGTTIFD